MESQLEGVDCALTHVQAIQKPFSSYSQPLRHCAVAARYVPQRACKPNKRRQVAPRSSETPQPGSFVSSADLAVLAEQIEVELSMEVLEPATAPEA
eukprot:COSAG04_NODE_348_length_16121_cov_7.375172_14_plen_96_part_00